ncbi:MAG: hypothetical protein Ta2A_00570 [Treponemataceae bacterium]|nr:MAG: hypothetical protein Ta2A_00570 [Treponemataceae bacterium]
MVYGYIRVSTDKQTVENQRFEIERFCSKNNLTVEHEFATQTAYPCAASFCCAKTSLCGLWRTGLKQA